MSHYWFTCFSVQTTNSAETRGVVWASVYKALHRHVCSSKKAIIGSF